jgi:hypothetical protein
MSRWLDPQSGREVWVVDAARVDDWPDATPWACAKFCLLFAARHVVEVEPLARRAVEQGLATASAWGPGCSMMEEEFDEAIVAGGGVETADNVVHTTSHPDESLEEALEFFLDAVSPARDYESDCRAWVVFPIGKELHDRFERALERRNAQRVE